VTTIPHAIHVATNPSPADGTLTVDPRVDLVLSWSPPTNPAPRPIIRYDVYFSTNDIAVGDPNMGLARYASVPADQALQITIPKTLLDFDVDYYWRVDTVTQATEVPSDPNFGLRPRRSFSPIRRVCGCSPAKMRSLLSSPRRPFHHPPSPATSGTKTVWQCPAKPPTS
jgi:hypothetical protein